MNKIWAEIADTIVYVIAGIGAVFVGVKTLVRNKIFHIDGKDLDIVTIQHILEKHRLELDADRVDLLEIEFHPGREEHDPLITLVAEAISHRSNHYVGLWDKVVATGDYKDLIKRTYADGFYIGHTATLGATVLKQAMVALGIANTIWVRIGFFRKKYWLVSVSWNEEKVITEIEMENIRIAKEEITVEL